MPDLPGQSQPRVVGHEHAEFVPKLIRCVSCTMLLVLEILNVHATTLVCERLDTQVDRIQRANPVPAFSAVHFIRVFQWRVLRMRSECGAPLQEVPELKRMTLGTSRHMRKSHGAGGIDSRIKTSGMSRIPNAIAPGPHPIKPLRAMLAYDRLIHADQGARHGLPDHYRTTATSFSTEAFGTTSAPTEFQCAIPPIHQAIGAHAQPSMLRRCKTTPPPQRILSTHCAGLIPGSIRSC